MIRKLLTLCISAALLLGLAACGAAEDGSASVTEISVSGAESAAVSEASELSSEERSVEASVIEEAELTTDEMFTAFLEDAEGICLKLQIYDNRGTPVRNGGVEITAVSEAEVASSLEEAGICILATETDFSGFAFISNLQTDECYVLTVTDSDGEPAGSVTLTLTVGESLSGDTEDGAIHLTIPDGDDTPLALAITATDRDGSVSAFTLSRLDTWQFTEE